MSALEPRERSHVFEGVVLVKQGYVVSVSQPAVALVKVHIRQPSGGDVPGNVDAGTCAAWEPEGVSRVYANVDWIRVVVQAHVLGFEVKNQVRGEYTGVTDRHALILIDRGT
jgi:hypothetical protein